MKPKSCIKQAASDVASDGSIEFLDRMDTQIKLEGLG